MKLSDSDEVGQQAMMVSITDHRIPQNAILMCGPDY